MRIGSGSSEGIPRRGLCAGGSSRLLGTVAGPAVLLLAFLLGELAACTSAPGPRSAPRTAREQPVVEIPLAGDIARQDSQISGLAWYGDDLIALPQFPDDFPRGEDGTLFALSRGDILDYLDGRRTEPLVARSVSFVAPQLRERVPGYDGFESIAFQGDRAYLTVELWQGRRTHGLLLAGRMAPDLSALTVDTARRVAIPAQADLGNMADEALVIVGGKVITFYEINGANLNPQPVAHVYDEELQSLGTSPCPTLEYRITDATAADERGRFWVANFFFPGDRDKIRPAPDALAKLYGIGPTHQQREAVERLVEMQYRDEAIVFTKTPVIQLQLNDDAHCRNWEGIVRLEGRGFLLMTDEYPRTILAFVAAP
jgi:hypothetical protein